ncbi:MAG: RagB/SusD family nutrient uptake outer membrane protein [Bacteroidetes bacterium]|nr:RagB/SusD family nutrient uptake outer membrane protein [Bacteroidota bacterium]
MIRKKYITISSLLLSGLLSFTSCDKNLDIEPTKELESNYFQNEERIQRGVGAAYAAISNIYGPQLNDATQHGFWLLPGDDITSDGSGNTFETFSGLNGSTGLVEGQWKRLYAVVSRCNFMLEKFDEPEIQKLYTSDEIKNANRGEMLFLRSYCFYKLWDWYRKAPIQGERISSIPDALLEPSSGFEMLDNAIAALEEAATLLPASWDNRNLGRITKDGANGLLVKCYVLRACYNNKSTDDYNKAITAYGRISNTRQLVKFGENFDYRTENNAESLFEFQASHAPAQDNAWLSNDFGGDVGQMGAFYHYFDGHLG